MHSRCYADADIVEPLVDIGRVGSYVLIEFAHSVRWTGIWGHDIAKWSAARIELAARREPGSLHTTQARATSNIVRAGGAIIAGLKNGRRQGDTFCVE